MSIPWPRCGKEDPHPAHQAPAGHDCPGWTADQQLVRYLVTSVNEYVSEHYPLRFFPDRHRALPEGLRLERHPSVRRMLMMDPDLLEPGWPQARGDGTGWFPCPVKVATDMPKGQWRLVIVTEEVLLAAAWPAPEPAGYSDDPAMTGRKQRS